MARPLVTVHVAQSLDGRIGIEGRATPLSTAEGRAYAHAMRASHDAVLVGASTVRIDDPRLTVRDGSEAEARSPLRVVLASSLDLPRGARVFGGDGRSIVIGAEGRVRAEERAALEAAGVAVIVGPRSEDGRVAVEGALTILAERGVRRLLVEGGSKVLTSFLRAKCVDSLSVEIATRLLGSPGTGMLGAIGVGAIGEAPSLTGVTVERLGENVIVRGDVVYA
ncbi:MAG: RibD family protein [Labilithrix sp.]|nr:RibD family protein [Labilithrix sp.]